MYPATTTQQQTALRRGWEYRRLIPMVKKSRAWVQPENFTAHDQARIDRAAARRLRRHRSAD